MAIISNFSSVYFVILEAFLHLKQEQTQFIAALRFFISFQSEKMSFDDDNPIKIFQFLSNNSSGNLLKRFSSLYMFRRRMVQEKMCLMSCNNAISELLFLTKQQQLKSKKLVTIIVTCQRQFNVDLTDASISYTSSTNLLHSNEPTLTCENCFFSRT